jgi:protein SCO1
MRVSDLLRKIVPALLAVALATAVHAHDRTQQGTLVDESESFGPIDHAYVPPEPETLGGSWDLVDHDGRLVTDRTYRGKWMLVFFGFAACREACPGALMTMSQALDQLGADADEVQPLFIDFTMEEPDLRGLAQFVGNFHPRLVGLTGDRRQTFEVVRKFKVRREFAMANYSSKETGNRINHTTYFYVIDPDGVTRGYFSDRLTAEEAAAEIRHHMARHPARMPVPAPATAEHKGPRGVDLDTLYRLSTQEGEHMDGARLRGRPTVLVFGYTNCPEVCPTSLLELTGELRALGPDADRLNVLFVTVDPERDTAERLRAFMSNFDPRIHALTGSLDDVLAVAGAFGATVAQGDKSREYYSVNHTASTFLIDRYGMLAEIVPYRDSDGLSRNVRRLLAQ